MFNKLLYIFLGSLFFVQSGCVAPETTRQRNTGGIDQHFERAYTIRAQKAPPPEIQSLQLYRNGSPNNPPVIQLNSGEQLVLEFDHLGDLAKQFKAEVTHMDRNWNESALAPGFFLSGFNSTYFGGGLKNLGREPAYFHYSFEFPNEQLSFKASGNYLLSIFDYNSGDLLFTLPFLITENEGSIETDVEEGFARREDLRRQNQLFSRYTYPAFVEFPRFDLAFLYVQNQFWGRSREVNFFDTSTQGQVHFHLGQDQAFTSDYVFNTLDLTNLSTDGRQIINVEESPTPPVVILRRDVQNLNAYPALTGRSLLGFPVDGRTASYANVKFRLETAPTVGPKQRIYLVGDFNNWMIRERNRMVYNHQSGLWEGSALIKEGRYSYKYVTLQDRTIDDLSLDQSYLASEQEYLTLVYYRDPARNYDRLLQVKQTVTN